MIDLPKFALSRTTTATTYHFDVVTPRRCGWALCTVNDHTGELLITSDWGDWSHRWNASPKSLGADSLTRFIAGAGALLFAEFAVILISELVGRYRFGTLTRRQMRTRAELRASILMRAL